MVVHAYIYYQVVKICGGVFKMPIDNYHGDLRPTNPMSYKQVSNFLNGDEDLLSIINPDLCHMFGHLAGTLENKKPVNYSEGCD